MAACLNIRKRCCSFLSREFGFGGSRAKDIENGFRICRSVIIGPVLLEFSRVNMSHQNEKRTGSERRLSAGAAHAIFGERRTAERRQTIIAEISFAEWVSHFVYFKQRRAGASQVRQEAVGTMVAYDQSRQK